MKSAFVLQVAKVVGTPGNGDWSQVHTFFPEDEEKKEKRGDLLAILSISGVGEGIEAVAAGREVLGRLHEEYYGNLDGEVFSRLKLSLQKISEENENLEVIAGVVYGKILYLAILGKGSVFLKRGEKLGLLLKGIGGETKTASGYLEADDFLVLGSDQFFRVVGAGVLKAALQTNFPDEAIEVLTPIILGRQEMAKAAAVLMVTKKVEQETVPIKSAETLPEVQESPLKKEEKSIIRKFLERVKLPSKRQFFIRDRAKTKRKKIFAGILILLLLGLSGSIFFGIKNKIAADKVIKSQSLAKQAEEKLNQGKSVAESNPNEGKVLGAEAKKLAEEATMISKDNEEANMIKDQVDKFLSSLGEEVSIQPSVFMDLNLIADGALAKSFALLENKLAILDSQKKKIYFLDLSNKSHQEVLFEETSLNLIAADDKVFVTGENGVFEVSLDKKPLDLGLKKESWKGIISFSSFGGNLYFQDTGNIWRSQYFEGNFGSLKSWFLETPPDMSSWVDMAIDGSIWILTKDKILKFALGKQDSFSLSKMPESFSDPVKIYTSSDDQNLYILDKDRGRVYVISKSGEYKASYAWEGIKQVTDLVALESSKKIFVLSGSKIYEIKMK